RPGNAEDKRRQLFYVCRICGLRKRPQIGLRRRLCSLCPFTAAPLASFASATPLSPFAAMPINLCTRTLHTDCVAAHSQSQVSREANYASLPGSRPGCVG